MLNRIFLFLWMMMGSTSWAQQVVVRGEAKGYEGKSLSVMAVDNEFSERRIVLAQCYVSDSGNFQIQFDIRETQRVYIHIQRVEAPLYVQRGNAYDVIFPQCTATDFKRFDNTVVSLQFKNLPLNDINAVVGRFNVDFATFIRDHFYDFASEEYRGSPEYLKYVGKKRDKVDLYARFSPVDTVGALSERGFSRLVEQFEDSVLSSSEFSSDIAFTDAYKRFSLAELHLLSGMERMIFYERYFISTVPLYRNPAYVSCFRLFTRNILIGQKEGVQAGIIRAINVDRNLDRLADALPADYGLQSVRLKQLAAINGLKDVYYSKSFDRNSMDLLLEKVSTSDSLVNEVARATALKLKLGKAGTKIQDFVFTDETQEKWTLSNADGLPLYLLFYASWSPSSLKEILVMERVQSKFKGRVQFVAVCMDDDYRNYRKHLEDNLKLPIKLLYGNVEPFIYEKFNVRAIPHQVMLDAQGLILADFCPAPSDPSFESFINRSLPALPSKQGQRTWKDR
jgi:thiol-disulfide isomerase/thioredoxin